MAEIVRIIATREQMNALKAQGWRVVGPHGGGSYIMESPRAAGEGDTRP